MRRAYSVETVRAAERALMARLPEGALMQRAAAGLAAACAGLLRRTGRVYGRRVVLLVGSGDNGGDALYAGARLARRGRRGDGRPRLARPGARRRPRRAAGRRGARGRRTRRAAAGRTSSWTASSGSAGKGGLRPDAAALAASGRRRSRSPPWSPSTCPAGSTPTPGRCTGAAVRADATVTFGTYKPGLLIDPAARARGRRAARGHRAGPELPDAAGSGGAPARGRGGAAAGAGGRERQVPAGCRRDRRRVRALPGRGGARRRGRAARRGGGRAVRRARRRTPCSPASRRPWCTPGRRRRPDGCRPGSSGPGLGDGRAGRPSPTCWRRRPRAGRRGRAAAAGPRDRTGPDRRPPLLTPHAGEAAALLGVAREEVEAGRLAAVRELAARYGATVLLKGSTTLVADRPATPPYGSTRPGTAWLATAGSGDVLSGLAGSLLAAGSPRATPRPSAPTCTASAPGTAPTAPRSPRTTSRRRIPAAWRDVRA